MSDAVSPSAARPIEAGVALVTGGGQRIGRAISQALAEDGWAVAVHHLRSASQSEEVVAEIAKGGGRAIAIAADLTDATAATDLIPRVAAKLGPVTCLVNNASVFEPDDVLSATQESWRRHIDVNLRAPFFLSQSFAKEMVAGAFGCIINIIDERVWNLTPHFASYTMSKSGLWTLTQTCALALAPGIRVNGIGPGPTLPSPRQSREHFETQAALTPLGRGTTPGEIVSAVRFILSSPAMTGQMIALDGGRHLKWRRHPDDADLEE
ncbi:MAG: SDR family oxidoreductase [Alphaproteobacteria bacterium]|nr:SDR family oxidoreductase [Alphaproteobacteria bacterium]MCY4499193.1 SDR family oxidoreductase [Rhodospirillaceae bacterium]